MIQGPTVDKELGGVELKRGSRLNFGERKQKVNCETVSDAPRNPVNLLIRNKSVPFLKADYAVNASSIMKSPRWSPKCIGPRNSLDRPANTRRYRAGF